MVRTVLLGIFIWLSTATFARSSDFKELVLDARKRNMERIQTLTCTVERHEGIGDSKLTVTGEYFRSPSFVHVKETGQDNRRSEFLLKNSEILCVDRFAGEVSAGRRSSKDVFCNCDVWDLMLIQIPGRRTSVVNVEDLLAGPLDFCEWAQVSDGQRQLTKLHCRFSDPDYKFLELELYFDPRVNYLIRKLVARHGRSETFKTIREVLETEEPQNGIFFPTKSSDMHYNGTELIGKTVNGVSKLVINQPFPKGIGTLVIPPGVSFSDRIRGVSYVSGVDGQGVTKVERMNTSPVMLPRDKIGSPTGRPTATEGVDSWDRLLIYASAGAVGIAAVLLWLRAKKAASGAA